VTAEAIRAAVGEHAAWVLAAAAHPDSWAALVERHGLRGVGPGPEGAQAVAAAFCGWYLPHADPETAAWLRGVPAALAAQVEPPAAVRTIFANARRTARAGGGAGAAFDVRLSVGCPGCGAAQERARVFTCGSCGGDLFPARPGAGGAT
jgi:hypothetical protein